MNNSIHVINPYKLGKFWVFDEPRLNLYKELFVESATKTIDRLVHILKLNKRKAEKGMSMIFSAHPFPDAKAKLTLLPKESNEFGSWYLWKEQNLKCWLCPALFLWYPSAPENLYFNISL